MKSGIPRNSCLSQCSRRIKRRLLYPHPKLSLGLVSYKPFCRVDVVYRKMVFYITHGKEVGIVYINIFDNVVCIPLLMMKMNCCTEVLMQLYHLFLPSM